MLFTPAVRDAAIGNVLDSDFDEEEPEDTELDESNEVFVEL